MSTARVSLREAIARWTAAPVLIVVGILLAVAHLGVLSVVLGVGAFVLFATVDGLIDRAVALVGIVAGLLVLLSFLGPVVHAAASPAVVGAAVTVPGAVAMALSRPLRRPSRSSLEHDAVIVLAGLGSAACFGYGYLSGDQASRLRAMIHGGTDYLAHFDLLQNVWVHHGFPFVNGTGPFVERRADLMATPTGFHAVWSLIGTLVTGRSAPPRATRLLDFLAASYVAQAVLLTVVTAWAVSRVLRAAQIGTAAAVPALLFAGAATVIGPVAGLNVDGFATFVLGLALVIIAITFAVTASRTGWQGTALVVWCAAVAGAFTYTLVIPALAAAWAIVLWRAREQWRGRLDASALVLVGTATLVAAMIAAAVTVLPNGSAITATGGIDPIPRGLLLGVTVAVAVTLLLPRGALHPAVRWLTLVASGTAAVCAVFWAEQVITVGSVRYYAEKTAYVWLVLALIAAAVLGATLVHRQLMTINLSRRRGLIGAVLSLAAVWSFGYVGPNLHGVSPMLGAQPVAVRWFLDSDTRAAQRPAEQQLAADVLTASRIQGPALRVLWESMGNTRHSRWMAILGGHWTSHDDTMVTDVIGEGGSCSIVALSDWLRAHPRDTVLVAARGPLCVLKASQMARGPLGGQVVVHVLH